MNINFARILKQKKAKLLVVDQSVEERIKMLMEELDTSALDVVSTATSLLEQAVGKKVILRDPTKDYDIVIETLIKKQRNK